MKKYQFQWVLLPTISSLVMTLMILLTSIWSDKKHISQVVARPATQHQVSIDRIQKQAKAISVKIISKEGFVGSGVLVQKQNKVYKVVTNAHVLRAGSSPYQIETNDGKVYKAKLRKSHEFGGLDIALLEFVSSKSIYTISHIGSFPKFGDNVFACGFPEVEEENPKFMMTDGKISFVLTQPLSDGYQLGHTNNIESGMSGGALLNSQGELIGIGGKQAHPVWDIPYKFVDRSAVPMDVQRQITSSSWSIPIKSVGLR